MSQVEVQVTDVVCDCYAQQTAPAVARNESELLHWLLELREHSGWRYFMRRAMNRAVAKRRQWDKPLTEEQLTERNYDIAKSAAVLELVQLLDRDIATLEQARGEKQ
jgi:hypothetical protein